MIENASVAALVEAADFKGDGQAIKSRELIVMLLACSAHPFSRSQFTPGHITCTGLVLSPSGGSVLLVHHCRLDRWLLPGGHVEPEDAGVAEAARREVIEETSAQLMPDASPTLISADVHGIPASDEPYHLHHDLIFLFRAAADEVMVSEESRDVVWCALADFDRYQVPDNVRRAAARR